MTKIQKSNTTLKIRNFNKRWNIQLDDVARWKEFKERVLNSYAHGGIGGEVARVPQGENEFFKIISVHHRTTEIPDIDFSFKNPLADSPTYHYLEKLTDIKKLIFSVQALFWMNSISQPFKNNFLENIKNDIVISGVPLEVKQTQTDVLFYPAGAKLLDEKLVNDNMNWLLQYPKSYDAFKNALSEFGKKGKERDVVDNMRLSLELLLKGILKNQKSLEKQQENIGAYLKGQSVSTEISTMFWKILDFYNTYQNNKAKHGNMVSPYEVEFIIYLTGTFMRFLLTLTT